MSSTAVISQIAILTTPEAEEPVAALLERLFNAPSATYANIEKGHSVITLYARASVQQLRQRRAEVEAGLRELTGLGLALGAGEITIRRVPREDWSESWKKYFKTIQVGSSLLIRPSWSKQKAKPGQAVVVLDPGLSFGTGQHATTSFCLKQIVAARRPARKPLSLLDAGCGSGILAISAAKLGFRPVDAFDFDPVAVRVARKNCRSNKVDAKVRVDRKDLTRLALQSRQRYDVVCANLMAGLLLSQRDKLLNRLALNGTLVLAGILETEFAKVCSAYEQAGLQLIRTRVEREWQSGAFRRIAKKA